VRNDGERTERRILGRLPPGDRGGLIERQGWPGLTDLFGGIAVRESLSLPVESGRG